MYVITGASGNTGGVVARRLLANGKQVRVLGRSAAKLEPLARLGAEPFVADLTDIKGLTDAFTGATAVYVMIPPDATSQNFRAQQDHTTEALASALERTKVTHAVSLSSFGADKTEKTGPVVGLHNLEQRLNRIAGLNVVHLRAGYFMENTLAQVGVIKNFGITAGPVTPELKLPMIATRDIGEAAAQVLLDLSFRGQQTRELQGQRDLSYEEVASIIGKAINKPGLTYQQLPDDQLRDAFQQMGMSLNMTNLILEMAAALNSGHMRELEPRTEKNTTPTSFEQFVVEEFVPRFKEFKAAA